MTNITEQEEKKRQKTKLPEEEWTPQMLKLN